MPDRRLVERAHAVAAHVTGQIAMAMARGRINPRLLTDWADTLRRAADMLERSAR